MKVKVKPYKTACYNGQWYNQGDEFECENLAGIQGDVTEMDAPRAPETAKPKQNSKKDEAQNDVH
jgi:hypothetical protein